MVEQRVQFCTAEDGAKIAYSITGEGPPLVRAAHYLSHLEYDFESPVWKHWIRELSRYNTYIRYDERGCGLSDHNPPEFSFKAWVSDLEAVVDSVGLDKFDLLGVSQGGAVAIAYAATHPDRVKHLILYGAYARGWGKRSGATTSSQALETRQTMHKLIELGWGQDNPAFRQVFTSLFVPEGGPEQQGWFNELQRVSCSPKNAMAFDAVFSNIDVTALLEKVTVPTLVLHARHDSVAPFEEGRLLASEIPGSRFTSFDGRNHILLENEPAWGAFLREVRQFLGSPPGDTYAAVECQGVLKIPMFKELLPGGLRFGANYLVEFEPESLWYEASLTLTAQAVRAGHKSDYHTFTHFPDDVRASLRRQGLDVEKLERNDIFRIWDSYTVQGGIEASAKIGKAQPQERVDLRSVKMSDWDRETVEELKAGLPEVDLDRVHVDDNTSVLLQYNSEKEVIDHFRSITLQFARRSRLAAFHTLVSGVYGENLYKQFESFCDGIIDFRSREKGGAIEQLMRVRSLRGAKVDSSWRRLLVSDSGEVMVGKEAAQLVRGGAEEERRLAVIMFTDTVGSTALAQRDEALAVELMGQQRRLIRPLVAANHGREVKSIGDGFLIEFSSALDAVRCAAAIQKSQKDANDRRPPHSRLQIRIGIHLGDVIHTEGDVAGDAVNVASRIESLAPPGGICVTAQVQASVFNKVDYKFESLGAPPLKGVAARIEVYRILGYGVEGWRPPQEKSIPSPRIAVLPLANISPERADEYFADGMTEELISAVSKTQGLRVIARTSVMKYKGTSKSVSEIGRELAAGNVLEGSVRKAGDKVRITVQLVDTSNEEPKWSQEYDRQLSDIFALQSDIAQKVAEALKVHVLGAPPGREAWPTSSTDAYVDYLRGRQAWNRRTEEGLRQAIGLFEKALAADRDYAMAYSGLADSYATLALLEFVAPNEAYPKAKEAVGKALALNPQLAEAHTSLGLIRFQYDWDWAGAEEEFREAIRLNPNYAPAHHYFADYLKAMGRFEDALAEIAKPRSSTL